MSEQVAETPVEDVEQKAPPQEGEQAPAGKTYDEAYVKELRAEAAKYRSTAKAAQAEAEQARKAQMSEAERAIAEARSAGAAEAVERFGKRLARTEFDAIAGRRNADFDTAPVFEFLDLGRFLGEDGEPDVKAIKAAVERLVPAPPSGPPSFDGGPRTSAAVMDPNQFMNKTIRSAAGRE
jgi:hypothetical protein